LAQKAQSIPSNIDALTVLKRSDVFGLLTVDVLANLAGLAKTEHYAHRSLIVPQGRPPEYLRFIVSGSVDLTLSSQDGGVASLPITAGRWATWAGAFSRAPLPHEMWSSKAAQFIAFPSQAVREAVAAHPEALLRVIDRMGETMRFLIAWTLSTTLFTPEKRLAYLLFQAVMFSDPSGTANSTTITQQQLAQLGLGTRQRVARLLRVLEKQELIKIDYRSVVIPSRERLRQFSGVLEH
jgi:CRP-like cAMP-binding protein